MSEPLQDRAKFVEGDPFARTDRSERTVYRALVLLIQFDHWRGLLDLQDQLRPFRELRPGHDPAIDHLAGGDAW